MKPPSLAAEFDRENNRMAITIMADGAEGYHLFRISKSYERVRGLPSLIPASNVATIVYDYEAPLNKSIKYSAFALYPSEEGLIAGPWSRNVTVRTDWPSHWLTKVIDEEV